MPQFDLDTFLPQLVWLAITFTFLYVLMARHALPRVAEILEERQSRLDDDLELAESHKAESEKLEADYEKLIAEARAEAQAHLKAERKKLEAVLNDKRAEMTAKLDKQLGEAEANIAKAKTAAMGDLEKIATEACVLIVTKLSGQKLTATEAGKAVKSSLRDRG